MASEDNVDKTLVCACACCSPARCVSRSGKLLLSWKSSLVQKSRALLPCLKSSDPSPSAHQNSPLDLGNGSLPSTHREGERSPSAHPLNSNRSSFKSRAPRRVYEYDVFLSFRGTDTRNNIVDHLYNHLSRKGIFAFKDDERLEKGEELSSQLLQAIRDSRVSIVVFSSDYASSTWCMEEMAAIAECKNQFEQRVFPIFYNVEPSDVRKQSGVYENAFISHSEKFDKDPYKVARWKRAMTDLANLVGWDLKDKPEFTEIQKIVQKVIKALDHKFSGSADDLIGIQPRVREGLLLKLNSEDDDSRVLGLWGMGGIGKTTLATVLYDKISSEFDACCFIENVSKFHKDGGATAVQREILRQTLDEQIVDECHSSKISDIIRNRLCPLKVLVVLDNIDEVEQLENLALNSELLGSGSRLIITTRNEHIFTFYKVVTIHKVSLLDYDDARELFCGKAFKSDVNRNSKCEKLIPDILEYTQSLPLAIKVVGSFLCNRDAFQWREALERLRKNPDKKISDVLQISFEGLQKEEKEIFLHIACFFNGEREEYVRHILNCCGLYSRIGIKVLLEKSLIAIWNQEIQMHEMLQEMGKNIVREESPEDPVSWSRLWLYKDFENAMMSETETNHVKAIVLNRKEDVSKHSHQMSIEGLSKMRGLKLLILYNKNFVGSLNFLSNKLQYLFWHGYRFSSLPSFGTFSSLVELSLPYSKVKRLWEGRKNIPYLERVDLSNSKNLIETPNFEWCPILQRLDLTGCISLEYVHPSIGLLTKLAYLSLRNCISLESLDFGPQCKLSSLRVLHLSGCTKLKCTPRFMGLSNIEYLDIQNCTHLSLVDGSVEHLKKLKFLSFRGCEMLWTYLNIEGMTSIETLDLSYCQKLERPFPDLERVNAIYPTGLESLISLDLSSCNLKEFPDSVKHFRCLERLNLEKNDFSTVPYTTFQRLSRLAYLNLAHCPNLAELPVLHIDSASSGGRYFQTMSSARNHRSGLYIFNCPKLTMRGYLSQDALTWLSRLAEQPCHFRCGFDIIVPADGSEEIPEWFFSHQFGGGSIIRIVDFDAADDDNWLGFAFCVEFELNKGDPGLLELPCPLDLCFENEQREEYFDAPPCVNKRRIEFDDKMHYWVIYIQRRHCHFVKTGACISIKANPALKVHKWGLCMVFKQDIKMIKRDLQYVIDDEGCPPHFHFYRLSIEDVHECNGSNFNLEPKVQLPYNWLVSEEEENEIMQAKTKEDNLSNVGLLDTDIPPLQ